MRGLKVKVGCEQEQGAGACARKQQQSGECSM